jgi:hypothetical protein
MKVYVVEVLNIDTSRVDKVFYTKSKPTNMQNN